MSMVPTLANWIELFTHFASLSLLAVGGAITTAPDMHRYLVAEQGWLSDAQFSSSIALSQAAPGPNVLFVALLGWNVGVNAGGPGMAGWLLGALVLGFSGALALWAQVEGERGIAPVANSTDISYKLRLIPVSLAECPASLTIFSTAPGQFWASVQAFSILQTMS